MLTDAKSEVVRWPDTTAADPPEGGERYRVAVWLLGRHPRLARRARRVAGVVHVEDPAAEPFVDLDHLGKVFAQVAKYDEAWRAFERRNPPPQDDASYDAWMRCGPVADDFALGLSDLLVMSSGEVASLRILATLGSVRVPLSVLDLVSLDAEGQRLLADWCEAIQP